MLYVVCLVTDTIMDMYMYVHVMYMVHLLPYRYHPTKQSEGQYMFTTVTVAWRADVTCCPYNERGGDDDKQQKRDESPQYAPRFQLDRAVRSVFGVPVANVIRHLGRFTID